MGTLQDERLKYYSGNEFSFSDYTFVVPPQSEEYGGAIRNSGGSGTIVDSLFSGNVGLSGGAIYNDSGANDTFGDIELTGVDFFDNSAVKNGGAIRNLHASLTINYGQFSGNSAADRGGAIDVTDTDGLIKISGATFDGNIAAYGGALTNSGKTTVEDTTFKNNSASYGGAIRCNKNTIDIKNATFSVNSATNGGAAIHTYNASANVSGGTFIGNSTVKGGAIYNEGSVNLSGANFASNIATNQGGAINNVAGKTIDINGGVFTSNVASATGDKLGGGAIYNAGTLNISGNASFIGNSAQKADGNGSGGAINNAVGATANITDVSFEKNVAKTGAAIYNLGTVTIARTTFKDNDASNAGAIYNHSGSVTLAGDNVFSTHNDNIINRATLNISGSNTFGGSVETRNNGIINFDEAAVTTLTGSAYLYNNTSAQQTLNGTLLVCLDKVMQAKAGVAFDYELSNFVRTNNGGTWDYSAIKVGTTVDNADVAGKRFTNDNGAQLWFVDLADFSGITNVMTVDGTLSTDANAIKFASFASLKTACGEDFNGVIKVTGGEFGAKTFADNASLVLNGGNFGTYYVFGGTTNADGKAASVTVDGAITSNRSIYAGNQFLSSYNGDVTLANDATLTVKAGSTITTTSTSAELFLVAGSLLNGTGAVTDESAHTLTIEGDATASGKFLIGTNVVGGSSNVTASGDVTMNLGAGSYTYVAGAGYIQSDTAAITQSGDVTMNITGGSYKYIYGGVLGQYKSYVSHATMTGDVNITVDTTGTNAVSLKYLFAGQSSLGGFTGNAKITFTGLGSNLTFDAADAYAESTVNGGNAVKTSDSITGYINRSLVFNNFSGDFGAKYIECFTDLRFLNGSDVTFNSTSIKLNNVIDWEFEAGTTLDWQDGQNDFANDHLVFGEAGDSLTEDWTVIDSNSDDVFAGLASAKSVKIFGAKAKYSDGAWCTSNYKLFVDSVNKDLKIATLA